jgi:glycosyltransferase involved in cell wall biosynthesis
MVAQTISDCGSELQFSELGKSLGGECGPVHRANTSPAGRFSMSKMRKWVASPIVAFRLPINIWRSISIRDTRNRGLSDTWSSLGAFVIFARPSDVSAVVLTMGEPSTQEAVDSLNRQTVPPRHVIVVRDVSPFHKAFNIGVEQVKTPFFVQVDADMILDPHCVHALRNGMRRRVGIVVGRLRDALTEQVVGIKLFRAKCFENAKFTDSISPDTDFVNTIRRAGWKTAFIGELRQGELDQWATFGEHRPVYTLSYTYRKHLIEGCRYRYRRSINGLRWRFTRLESSRHPSALVAQIGLARGLFLERERDLLGRAWVDESFPGLDHFVCNSQRGDDGGAADLPPADMPLRERFHLLYRIGRALFEANALSTFRVLMHDLDDTGRIDTAWVSKVALCQGLLAEHMDDAAIDTDYGKLREYIDASDALPFRSGEQDGADLDLDAIMSYAGDVGLNHFVVTGVAGAEYRTFRSGRGRAYLKTARKVIVTTDRNHRPRIKAPFRLFGHIVCTEPDRLSGIFWSLDLLRSGYTFIHLPTVQGPKRVSLVGQFTKNLADRSGLHLDSLINPYRAFRKMTRRRSPRYQPEAGRVLMIVPNFTRGGAERQMVVTAAGLARQGCDVRIIGLRPLDRGAPSMEGELAKFGILPQLCSDFPVPRGGARLRPPPEAVLAADLSDLPQWIADKIGPIGMAIRHHRPAVVHTWLDGPAVIGGLAACALGVPRLVIAQASMSSRHHSAAVVEHLMDAYRYVARSPGVVMHNNSAAGAADYERWLGVRVGTIRVHYNGFMPETVRTPTPREIAQFRVALGFSADAPVVGSLIRFVEDKDPDLWIDTAAEIANARPDVRFLLAGYGSLHDAIVQRAKALGLGERLVLPGAVTDIGLVYAVLDVVLLTSSVEGVPNVLLEAQAAGRPAVTTDVGGTNEAVVDGRTALVVRQRSPKRLADAVLDILTDASWRARLPIEGPVFVAARFGFDRMIRETLESYGSLGRPRESFESPIARVVEPPSIG